MISGCPPFGNNEKLGPQDSRREETALSAPLLGRQPVTAVGEHRRGEEKQAVKEEEDNGPQMTARDLAFARIYRLAVLPSSISTSQDPTPGAPWTQ